eukprot:15477399-Alexandrium_andersonii.AAC.1
MQSSAPVPRQPVPTRRSSALDQRASRTPHMPLTFPSAANAQSTLRRSRNNSAEAPNTRSVCARSAGRLAD